MWTYIQSTGEILQEDEHVGFGYSGLGDGKNNAAMQNVPDIGPIPCGVYTIDPPEDSPTHGPFALPLTPSPENQMFSRSAFLIHGDSFSHPGAASEGCIIASRNVREAIWNSGDHQLLVKASA